MQNYYLIGKPIAHSLSPLMMNLSFETNGIDARYQLFETDLTDLRAHVEKLRTSGAAGWNVTMPVKTAMHELCDELSEAAQICGAVNTVQNRDGCLFGHTTDGAGFISALSRRGIFLKGKKLTLFGSGGAAGIILIQSALEGADEIFVYCNRPSSRAHIGEIAGKLQAYSSCTVTVRSYQNVKIMQEDLQASAVLVNATNIGMAGGPDPGGCLVPESVLLPKSLFIYDIIYHPADTPLILRAKAEGIACESGLSMLIGQGAESFRIWTGQDMPVDAVRNRLEATLLKRSL